MAITLRLLDQRVAGKLKEIKEDVPFPAIPLSVFRAAQMTVRRARRNGFVGTGLYAVVLQAPGKGDDAVALDDSKATWVPDGSTVTVSVGAAMPRTTTDRWLID